MKIQGFKGRMEGIIAPPPDKSITHRALIIGSMARGVTRVINPLLCRDTLSTIHCLEEVGCNLEKREGGILVHPSKMRKPEKILNCGNSGTTARLLAGVLSSREFTSILDGDESLRRRPMRRVVAPLKMMGAIIEGKEKNSFLPIIIKGNPLRAISYELEIPSAQVKSAIILAALMADGETRIKEMHPSRDHTERMLQWMGGNLVLEKDLISVKGSSLPEGGEIIVPGDISSASFFIAGATLVKNSQIVIENTGLNLKRTGFLRVLQRMGGRCEILRIERRCNEDLGDVLVCPSSLEAIEIGKEEIPSLIDEIPLIVLLATQAEGMTKISGAMELRFKESDRIRAISDGLRKMGGKIEELEDGLIIEGPTLLRGAKVRSYGDHRIAMTLFIAGLIAGGETDIDEFDCVDVSYPDFLKDWTSLCHG